VIILGAVLAVAGWLLGFAILVTIGILLLVTGLVLFALGSAGHPVRGRRHWF
jgi:hypothetical protein